MSLGGAGEVCDQEDKPQGGANEEGIGGLWGCDKAGEVRLRLRITGDRGCWWGWRRGAGSAGKSVKVHSKEGQGQRCTRQNVARGRSRGGE